MIRRFSNLGLICFLLVILVGGLLSATTPTEGSLKDEPDGGWKVEDPEAFGLDEEQLDRAYRRAADIERVSSLLVARSGTLVAEQYFRGLQPGEPINIKSASKSILSALTGIALQEGLFTGLDQPIAEIFPEYAGNGEVDQRFNTITLEHMLTMTTGLEPTSKGNYGPWVTSDDWIEYAFTRPMEDVPGGKLLYSTGTSHALGVMIARTSGMDLRTYAEQRLFGPLGIELTEWERDPQGNYLGGNNLWLTPRDLLRIGQLYLDGGCYQGEQIIPEAWVEASLEDHVWHFDHEMWYGYYWWTDRFDDHLVHFAWGYGGQFIYLFPELDLVVVTTSQLVYDTDDNYEHIDRLHDMVTSYILPAVEPVSQRS